MVLQAEGKPQDVPGFIDGWSPKPRLPSRPTLCKFIQRELTELRAVTTEIRAVKLEDGEDIFENLWFVLNVTGVY